MCISFPAYLVVRKNMLEDLNQGLTNCFVFVGINFDTCKGEQLLKTQFSQNITTRAGGTSGAVDLAKCK